MLGKYANQRILKPDRISEVEEQHTYCVYIPKSRSFFHKLSLSIWKLKKTRNDLKPNRDWEWRFFGDKTRYEGLVFESKGCFFFVVAV